MFSFSKNSDPNWNVLTNWDEFLKARANSLSKAALIFKHSTKCFTSSMAKAKVVRNYESLVDEMNIYYLDVIKSRELSRKIEAELGIRHESPQVILLRGSEVLFHTSHDRINPEKLIEVVQELA